MNLLSAKLESFTRVVLTFDHPVKGIGLADLSFSPKLEIVKLDKLEHVVSLHVKPVDLSNIYTVFVRGVGNLPVQFGAVLDAFVSDKPLGCTKEHNAYAFRVFAPRASSVQLMFTSKLDDTIGTLYDMNQDEDGVWEISLSESNTEPFYCYKVYGPEGPQEVFNGKIPIADPYGTCVISKNTYRQESVTVLPNQFEDFDWKDDTFTGLKLEDAVIYEMHVYDTTIHKSSGVPKELAGTYKGVVAQGYRGGFDYLKSLGVNAVEILPSQHFARWEPDYKQQMREGYYNTWNPYSHNHWGYMTTQFFAPDPFYAVGANKRKGSWNNVHCNHVREFKKMVQEFHKHGIAVIMDVVYNHTSQYNHQPLKYLDKHYYYRLNEYGDYTAESGCGNDYHSERPMARRLIVESILHWMREYHVDGFRFDLASLIDNETFIELRDRAQEINPDVILIAEPWGGGRHELARFSNIEMAAWNDDYRNSVKGREPEGSCGFIFGSWGWNSPEAFGKWVMGSTRDKGGQYNLPRHSVNYVESHDGYTLGDFIRIASGEADIASKVQERAKFVKLTPLQMKLNKLAAVMLMVSQGPVMIHQGQEFARAKIIAKRDLTDIHPGMLDHNSYEKNDETNWINYADAEANTELVQFYRALIALRGKYAALRRAPHEEYQFLIPSAPVASGFILPLKDEDGEQIAVMINPNPDQAAEYSIPEGEWRVIVEEGTASLEGLRSFNGKKVTVPPRSATICVLIEKQ
ncbi:MAG: pullulanase [Ectothiorhodospiraceae bacterium]|nr:pullulanase [Ectothiorhodospiraceae bacterium]